MDDVFSARAPRPGGGWFCKLDIRLLNSQVNQTLRLAMKCEFCNKPVFGEEGVSIPGRGVAHKTCLGVAQAMRRAFHGLDISGLNDEELANLKDLVLAEENSRRADGDDDVELF